MEDNLKEIKNIVENVKPIGCSNLKKSNNPETGSFSEIYKDELRISITGNRDEGLKNCNACSLQMFFLINGEQKGYYSVNLEKNGIHYCYEGNAEGLSLDNYLLEVDGFVDYFMKSEEIKKHR